MRETQAPRARPSRKSRKLASMRLGINIEHFYGTA